jgi:hypothetical protein
MNTTTTITIIGATVLLAAGLIGFEQYKVYKADNTPTPYAPLALCLKEKKAIFYGAFWCPHCINQKKAFGSAAKDLPYIECSTPNKEITLECKDAKIEGFPTWVFPSGERLSGEVPMKTLAEKSGCSLPATP